LGEPGNASLFGASNAAGSAATDAASWVQPATAQSVAEGTTIAKNASPFLDAGTAVSSSRPATIEFVAKAIDPSITGSPFADPDQAANLVPNATGQGGDAVATTVTAPVDNIPSRHGTGGAAGRAGTGTAGPDKTLRRRIPPHRRSWAPLPARLAT
jgi:hypothetical protein